MLRHTAVLSKSWVQALVKSGEVNVLAEVDRRCHMFAVFCSVVSPRVVIGRFAGCVIGMAGAGRQRSSIICINLGDALRCHSGAPPRHPICHTTSQQAEWFVSIGAIYIYERNISTYKRVS